MHLDRQEWWGKEQAVKSLQKLANPAFCKVASGLTEHQDEFVRGMAQQLSAQGGDPQDITALQASAMHENWQVREKAIAGTGEYRKSGITRMLKESVKRMA